MIKAQGGIFGSVAASKPLLNSTGIDGADRSQHLIFFAASLMTSNSFSLATACRFFD